MLSFQHRDENYYAPPLLLSTSENMFFELDRGENPNFFFLNLIDLPGNKEGEDRFRGIGFPRAGSATGLVSV